MDKVGLAGVGFLSVVVHEFYFAEPLADTFDAMAARCVTTRGEWFRLRQMLLRKKEIRIDQGVVVPIGDWHRAECNS